MASLTPYSQKTDVLAKAAGHGWTVAEDDDTATTLVRGRDQLRFWPLASGITRVEGTVAGVPVAVDGIPAFPALIDAVTTPPDGHR